MKKKILLTAALLSVAGVLLVACGNDASTPATTTDATATSAAAPAGTTAAATPAATPTDATAAPATTSAPAATAVVVAADGHFKAAVVNMATVMQKFGPEIQKQVEAQVAPQLASFKQQAADLNAKLQALQTTYAPKQKALEAEKGALTPEAYQQKQAALQADFKKEGAPTFNALMELQQKAQEAQASAAQAVSITFANNLQTASADVAKADGFNVVLSSQGVLYSTATDITPEVIAKLSAIPAK